MPCQVSKDNAFITLAFFLMLLHTKDIWYITYSHVSSKVAYCTGADPDRVHRFQKPSQIIRKNLHQETCDSLSQNPKEIFA